MAHVDVEYMRSAPAPYRPAASEAFGEDGAQTTSTRLAPPSFPRLEAGQLIRALLLICVGLGLWQLPQAARSSAVTTVAATKPL